VQVTASIGIAVASGWDTDAETLLRQADLAMYEAKRAGSGHAVYAAVDATAGL
jgi:predicted signal transduction protein with EAL and GGDEF domain